MKYLIKLILRFLLHFFWILPVNKEKYFFNSFDGKSQSCNPLYIYKQLKKNFPNKKYVWVYSNEIPQSKDFVDVKFVKVDSLSYIISQITAKFIIINGGINLYIPYRKRQIIINTWHGGGAYKKIDSKKTVETINAEKYECKYLTYFISSSKIFTDVMSQSKTIDKNKFLEIGMPRNDIFFNKSDYNYARIKVRNHYKIDSDILIVLYAPTYRGDFKKSYFTENLNPELIKESIKNRFGKKVYFFFRGHYSTKSISHNYDIDVSNYPDMQELLCGIDILITDYSSSIWDFSFTKKPCFLYCPDIEQYRLNPGFYTEPEEWGFPIAKNIHELIVNIVKFDENKYCNNIDENHKCFISYEKGNASELVCNLIV